MKIYLLLADEPFYMPACVGAVLDRWHGSVVGVSFPSGFFSRKRALSTLRLFGPLGFLRRAARIGLASLKGGAVHSVVGRHGLPIYPVESINAPDFLSHLRELGVDLVLSLNCPQKLKTEILRLPKYGCVNLHFGLLPKYRGVLPIMYAILNGEKGFGVTVHYMDEKLDNGDIILQSTVPIGPSDTLDTLYPKGFEEASRLLCLALERIEAGTVERKPNRESEKTYYTYPTAEVVSRYRQLARERRSLG
jgi:methionyl-tRNA formyltransferase